MQKKSEQGFALIEVLVSLLIFSLGVVGLVGMQSRALQVGMEAQDRNTAALLANRVASEMHAYKTTALSATAQSSWEDLVKAELPNGVGAINATSATNATITVTWHPPSRQATEQSTYRTMVVIPQ